MEPTTRPPARHGPARHKRDDEWAWMRLFAEQAICFHPGPDRGMEAHHCPECIAARLARA